MAIAFVAGALVVAFSNSMKLVTANMSLTLAIYVFLLGGLVTLLSMLCRRLFW